MNVDIEFKNFRVVSVSDNANSFGLHGHILIAEDGEAWEAGAGTFHGHKKGDTLRLSADRDGEYDWAHHGFEIPRRLPDAPRNVVNEVW
jgi:hypothetical protein